MPKSEAQLQAEVLDAGLLEQIAMNQDEFIRFGKLPLTERYLILAAANFVLRVQSNIDVLGISDKGALREDIQASDIIKTATGYEFEVGYPKESPASKYFNYVNKGVQGFDAGVSKNSNSPFKFKKKLNKKGSIAIGRGMAFNILTWLRRGNKLGGSSKYNETITKRQAKGKSLSKMVSEANSKKSLAYAVAVNIKKKGLKQTRYFDNAVDASFGKSFSGVLSKIIGKDIQLLIKQDGNNNQ